MNKKSQRYSHIIPYGINDSLLVGSNSKPLIDNSKAKNKESLSLYPTSIFRAKFGTESEK
ncbi:hypothetical protein FG386_000360 [Cryptosporidium ryanae]|uniref:uncharacterized protein n=1 Tax=Cryptosporidium ryanae TaxID=515981 RepID=UPI003519DEE4|nr:hypothetical protein FG386_000360 [Cryptosporidium ryanae]